MPVRLRAARWALPKLPAAWEPEVAPGLPEAPLFHASGLGLDSIDALELAVAIERQFRVSIPDEAVGKRAFSSVNSLTAYVAEHRTHWAMVDLVAGRYRQHLREPPKPPKPRAFARV